MAEPEEMTQVVIPPEEGVDLKAWESANALTNAEAHILMAKYIHNKRQELNNAWQPHIHVQKVQAYLDKMKLSANEQAVQAVRQHLQKYPVHEYEFALLTNLIPQTPAEARSLIPSLTEERFSDQRLEELLQDLHSLEKA